MQARELFVASSPRPMTLTHGRIGNVLGDGLSVAGNAATLAVSLTPEGMSETVAANVVAQMPLGHSVVGELATNLMAKRPVVAIKSTAATVATNAGENFVTSNA